MSKNSESAFIVSLACLIIHFHTTGWMALLSLGYAVVYSVIAAIRKVKERKWEKITTWGPYR